MESNYLNQGSIDVQALESEELTLPAGQMFLFVQEQDVFEKGRVKLTLPDEHQDHIDAGNISVAEVADLITTDQKQKLFDLLQNASPSQWIHKPFRAFWKSGPSFDVDPDLEETATDAIKEICSDDGHGLTFTLLKVLRDKLQKELKN